MATVEIRPATRADIEAFQGRPGVDSTVRATVGIVDGKPIAVGGLAFAGGVVIAFADVTADAKKHPIKLHKAALRVLAEARQAGHKVIFAQADANEPTAHRWLMRLGFVPENDKGLYRWQA